jgi:dynein heavy chain 1
MDPGGSDMEMESMNPEDLKLYIQSLIQCTIQLPISISNDQLLEFIHDEEKRGLFVYKSEELLLLTYQPVDKVVLALIKRVPKLNRLIALQDQLLIMNYPLDSGFSVIFDYLHYALSPYFEANLKGEEDKAGYQLTKKKLKELELSLVHLQKNVAIPTVILKAHPKIMEMVEQGSKDVSGLVQDSSFLNKIQNDVNSWIKEIQKVTLLTRDVQSGTARQEIEFWNLMERSLQQIENQLRTDHVQLTLEILKAAKRFHATVSFIADTGIKEATDKVAKYNQLMKDFPINELLAAVDLERIKEAIDLIFSHFNRKLKLSPYPVSRALMLAEAISKDFNSQILSVLSTRKLMQIPFDDFLAIMRKCREAFHTWDENVKEFISICRDVTRKRSERFIPVKINPAHGLLQERLQFVELFRTQHEQLLSTIQKVIRDGAGTEDLGLTDKGAIEDLQSAFEVIRGIDILDVTAEGVDGWIQAESIYNERISMIEFQIISRLRDRLATSQNAADMFRIFSKFNALFVRPKIRGAIHEYQSQLIERVKHDIKVLFDKFMSKHSTGESLVLPKVRDIPSVSGSIMWANTVERRLGTYMKKVEAVLGEGWEKYADGQKLMQEEIAFRKQLDTNSIFNRWVQEESNRDFVRGRIFLLSRNRLRGNCYELSINFDAKTISVFKEVRNLIWMGYNVPIQIQNMAKDSKRVYPFAVSLNETLRIYLKTLNKIEENPSIKLLVGGLHQKIQSLIGKGIQLRWDYFVDSYDAQNLNDNRHVVFVRELATAVTDFQEKVGTALKLCEDIEFQIKELARIRYDFVHFSGCLSKIQKNIDQLNYASFDNITFWCKDIDSRIQDELLKRLIGACEEWIHGNIFASKELGFSAKVQYPVSHHLKMRNQSLFLDPPIESAKSNLVRYLQDWLAVVTRLPRVRVFQMEQDSKSSTYSILHLVDSELIKKCYQKIEHEISRVSEYVSRWLQYQALWDLDPVTVFQKLGDDLGTWCQVIIDVRKSREVFDTSRSMKEFDYLTIDYGNIQTKVNAQYDQWQRELVSKFSMILQQRYKLFLENVQKVRNGLEKTTFGNVISDLINAVLFVYQCNSEAKEWSLLLPVFHEGQRILERQRFVFPPSWIFFDQINGEWSAFEEIMNRKFRSLEDKLSIIKDKILHEHTTLSREIGDLCIDWDLHKPIRGDCSPSEAKSILNAYETKFMKKRYLHDLFCEAKRVLVLDIRVNDQIVVSMSELKDIEEVWNQLTEIWDELEGIKLIPWVSDEVWKIKSTLDQLLVKLRDMPNRTRQYTAHQGIQNMVIQATKKHSQMLNLRSDSLRARHWSRILTIVNLNTSPDRLKVGDLWYNDQFEKHHKLIEEVILSSQGEMALEEFLKQVKTIWSSLSFEFTNFQNKCRLIKGWDDLFAKSQEHLTALNAMKNSAHYKVFKDEASTIEDQLSRLFYLLEKLVIVQKQWVYLQGIFTGNPTIRQILPIETNRFSSLDSEFQGLLRKIHKSPLVMEVLAIPNLTQIVDRLVELLNGIQRSLGDYLERERAKFARFYFLSDEDLLEILGNSKELTRVEAHLKKMFAATSQFLYSEDRSSIIGISSKEGEIVHFDNHVLIDSNAPIFELLQMVINETESTLYNSLMSCLKHLSGIWTGESIELEQMSTWITSYPNQVLNLAIQCQWTSAVETRLPEKSLNQVLMSVGHMLSLIPQLVIQDLDPITRAKCEGLIIELVHQRDVTRDLMERKVDDSKAYEWLSQLRVYVEEDQVSLKMANANFRYGFEYLGIPERLVRTPLTDKCFLTLTQALANRLGGSPFGPAGTGKTESVKTLANYLGRLCFVFCCDETFDFQSMGRIFVGLSKVGAWGCFDEFNRLEEKILSAVSQQIQSIQHGLRSKKEIELLQHHLRVHPNTGIFITMNPGYAGRSTLPDNLTTLFRGVAMTMPDKLLIAQVMLFSQGFHFAEKLASKVIPFFDICSNQLSLQPHYDFGLRALKSVLNSAGRLQRNSLRMDENNSSETTQVAIVVQSIRETVFPKLLESDLHIAGHILKELFPNHASSGHTQAQVSEMLKTVCEKLLLVHSPGWIEKTLQLHNILSIHHGVMMVGSSGTGKTQSRLALFRALEKLDNVTGLIHVINPKSTTKEVLYGWLDATTREWTDGVFTKIIRDIVEDARGDGSKRHWIVFDGEVDPEWVENLNSVLDDNKLLTLPNGERLPIPANVRILFEVEGLDQATPATVSRCGMVFYPDSTVTFKMMIDRFLLILRAVPVEELPIRMDLELENFTFSEVSSLQLECANILQELLKSQDMLGQCFDFVSRLTHIMEFTLAQMAHNLFSLLICTVKDCLTYSMSLLESDLSLLQLENFLKQQFYLHLAWSFGGGLLSSQKRELSKQITKLFSIPIDDTMTLYDYDTSLPNGTWIPWKSQVPTMNLDQQSLTRHDVVVPTIDTLRHEKIIYSWLAEHRSVILCGPPGSGKTMTLLGALRRLPDTVLVSMNFSSETSYDTVIRTLEVHGEYKRSSKGEVFRPKKPGTWIALFCDEINLPKPDSYGTQRIISFLRQLIEYGGFWRSDRVWIRVENVQVLAACNPPTDPGRVPLTRRFLRHCPVVFVDYPEEDSLRIIYSTFNRAVLKSKPPLRGYAEAITEAMIGVYASCQNRFNSEVQPHYIYSPRELTRWSKGMQETLTGMEYASIDDLIRILAHEGLRLFQDRLVTKEEHDWTENELTNVFARCFPGSDLGKCLETPILFSNYVSKVYQSTERSVLRQFLQARLSAFYEEEMDIPLVLFHSALDHILRIDRVFRQPQGHLLLIGISGCGKSTLCRFVCWMNGITYFQPSMHSKYHLADFEEDLRMVLKRSGCKGESICLLLDEANMRDTSFLERINTLLANSEIPGLFEGDDYISLMSLCKDAALRDGQKLDSHQEIYEWFCKQVGRNLHVVFTMNPFGSGLSKKVTTSPALFNRCVLNWIGDWDDQALFQIANEFTALVDLDKQVTIPKTYIPTYNSMEVPLTYRHAVLDLMIYFHRSAAEQNDQVANRSMQSSFVTPRHFLDMLHHFLKIYEEKRFQLEERQRHLIVGLDRLIETSEKVEELKGSLNVKQQVLETKSQLANEKLRTMVTEQQEAENKRAESVRLQNELIEQRRQIEERKQAAVQELSQAEPAVIEAQQSVSDIKKQHLTEVRSMGNPPAAVKLTMESVCILLGHKVDSWKTVQAILRRDDFISSIVNYDTSKLNASIRDEIRANYMNDPNFAFENVNRASKACGPLVKWVIAQIDYASILEKVGPLRQEVAQLEASAEIAERKAHETDRLVKDLEDSITKYKEEYAILIAEVQALKKEMEVVKERVHRSTLVLSNLSSEQSRWAIAKDNFAVQMDTLVGDCLLCAAFLSYAGIFDQVNRNRLLSDWKARMKEAQVSYENHLSIPVYLSTAEERSNWLLNSLPSDELCLENAVMLHRANRFPVIVDPSGQAVEYLKSLYRSSNIAVSSFRDGAFLKTLESALRFGTPILIQDAEEFDPILNPILNKEIRKSGGRNLCRLGKKDVDYAPSFKMFLVTKNGVNFSPDICSRVTIINFTITPASLLLQCLDRLLKVQRPDIETKRKILLKTQGEYQLRLHELEKQLLDSLNESTGNILDDETVMSTLETLKTEATDIQSKIEAADEVLDEIELVTSVYRPLADKMSSIFFCVDQLHQIEHHYVFSLEFFLDVFDKQLEKLQPGQSLEAIENMLFRYYYNEISISLRQNDLPVFALLLAQIRTKDMISLNEEFEWAHFLVALDEIQVNCDARLLNLFDAQVTDRLSRLVSLAAFKNLPDHILNNQDDWIAIYKGKDPEVLLFGYIKEKLKGDIS